MNTKWFNRESAMFSMQCVVILLNISLFSISSYFSIEDLSNVQFGIRGAVVKGDSISYAELTNDCELKKYCDSLKDFKKSGEILLSFICLDTILIVSIIGMGIVLSIVLKQVVAQKEALTKKQKVMLKILAFNKNLLYLHPVIINFGLIMWIVVSQLTEFSSRIVLHEGFAVLIVQSFISWLTLACNIWIISSIKRKNMRILKGKTYKNEDLSISI